MGHPFLTPESLSGQNLMTYPLSAPAQLPPLEGVRRSISATHGGGSSYFITEIGTHLKVLILLEQLVTVGIENTTS